MVLLDSTAPASAPGPPAKAGSYDLVGRVSARLVGQFSYGTLPPRSLDEARTRSATAGDVASSLSEFLEWYGRPGPLLTLPASRSSSSRVVRA
jgi:hypothetical protein